MKRIILILLSVILFLLAMGKFLDYHYKKFWQPTFDKLDVVFKDSTHYDGIYIGASQVHFGINPYYVDSVTGLQTYNLGMGGATINEMLFLANAYLSNHPAPKFAVLSVGHYSLIKSHKYLECPCYYFFYLDNRINNNVLSEQKYHTNLFKILPILKYTAFDDFNKITVSKNINGETLLKPEGSAYRGFINNSTTFTFIAKRKEEHDEADSTIQNGITMLGQLIQLLKKNNCMPIIVYPPELDRNIVSANSPYIKADASIKKLGSLYSVPILHYDTDSSFEQAHLFSDQFHLTINGAAVFSKKLGFAIKQLLSVHS